MARRSLRSAHGRWVAAEYRHTTSRGVLEGDAPDPQLHSHVVVTNAIREDGQIVAVASRPIFPAPGVVIDAAARAEQYGGNQTLGIAVSGSTAQRLGQDSPALSGQTLTLDALVSRVERGQLQIDKDTTIYFDEAGMADTHRLERLTEVVEQVGSKLVAIGDAAQLPSIGAGGMFERLALVAPSAELSNIRRTLDPDEQRACGPAGRAPEIWNGSEWKMMTVPKVKGAFSAVSCSSSNACTAVGGGVFGNEPIAARWNGT